MNHLQAFLRRYWPVIAGATAIVAIVALTLSFAASQRAYHAQRIAARTAVEQADEAHKLAIIAQQVSQANTDRLRADAELLCGGFVPISHAPLTSGTSELGHSIVTWAREGAFALNCPGR